MSKRKDKAYRVREEHHGLGCFGSMGVFLALVFGGLGLMWAGGGLSPADVAPTHGTTFEQAEEPQSEADEGESEPGEGQTQEEAEAAAEEEQERLAAELEGFYYYSQLGEADKRKYETMYRMASERVPVEYPVTSNEDVGRIYDCVMGDHPEFFYLQSLTMSTMSGSDTQTLEGDYLYSADEAAALEPQIEAAVAEAISGIPADADDYAKAKHVYEYLAAHVSYDHDALERNNADANSYLGQTVVDSLLDGNSVCAGYARGFQMAMQQMGIQCAYVKGELTDDGQSHAWCLALLDGEYCFVDPTAGDPSYQDDAGSWVDGDAADYSYLCFTTADAQRTRTADAPTPLPECTSEADSYYVREGREVSSVDDPLLQQWWDATAVGDSFQFRCTDDGVYGQMLDALVNGTVFAGGPAYQYSSDEAMRTFGVEPS